MFKFFRELLLQLRANNESMDTLRQDIAVLLEETRKMHVQMMRLNYEVLLLKQRIVSKQEKELLRYEIAQLRAALGLPPEDDDPDGFVM